jgi:hypothetical protein
MYAVVNAIFYSISVILWRSVLVEEETGKKLEHKVHKTKKNKIKNNSICVGHHYAQANRNNVNNTCGNMACIVLACRVDIT